jgi:8-oxo-dGTP pyrophosphatase MutT (NUDIX family)
MDPMNTKPALFHAWVGVMLCKDNTFLITRRCSTGWLDDYYMIPGGTIDGGLSITQTAIKEAYEETGITLHPEQLLLKNIDHDHDANGSESFGFILEATEWSGTVCNKEEHKCADMLWADSNNLPKNIIPKIAPILERINKRLVYSEFGWEN